MSDHTIQQHLIDPEICIRCNTCEVTCPVGAITHDSRNYVVDAEKCNSCMACVPPCPTGSIDNWRTVVKLKAYSVEEQLTWDELPAALSAEELADDGGTTDGLTSVSSQPAVTEAEQTVEAKAASSAPVAWGSTTAPWSAAHPYVNIYGPKAQRPTVRATITGNHRVTALAADGKGDYDTHHIVLDFGSEYFPVLEGQSIGVIAPGLDARGKAHHARQYSVASPRDGERPGYNNLSLTVKRVLEDYDGKPVRGVASNYLCDAKVGDTVEVIGPFGTSFLMPNHESSHIVMICTGTGSAPMRAMTEARRRLRAAGKPNTGQLHLYFGARTEKELPYFGPLKSLPSEFIDISYAYSREPNQSKVYVQDLMRQQAAKLAPLLTDPNAYFFVCGLKAMETGVIEALQEVATQAGLDWPGVANQLKAQGRLHLETY
jgi:benzoyl-CoA 2,3-epoxidase subunit A